MIVQAMSHDQDSNSLKRLYIAPLMIKAGQYPLFPAPPPANKADFDLGNDQVFIVFGVKKGNKKLDPVVLQVGPGTQVCLFSKYHKEIDPLVFESSYYEKGIRCINQAGNRIKYVVSSFLINPTLHEISVAGILETILVSSRPSPIHQKEQHADMEGRVTVYVPDYNAIIEGKNHKP